MSGGCLRAGAGFVGGAVATYAVVFFGTVFAWDIFDVVDRDGGGIMGIAFVIAPALALLGGIAGAWYFGSKGKTDRE